VKRFMGILAIAACTGFGCAQPYMERMEAGFVTPMSRLAVDVEAVARLLENYQNRIAEGAREQRETLDAINKARASLQSMKLKLEDLGKPPTSMADYREEADAMVVAMDDYLTALENAVRKTSDLEAAERAVNDKALALASRLSRFEHLRQQKMIQIGYLRM